MVVLIMVIAGYAIIFGSRGAFDKILHVVVGLVLMLTFLPGLLIWLQHELSTLPDVNVNVRISRPILDIDLGGIIETIIKFAALALIGVLAWRLRPWLARRKAERIRRNSGPRTRALPPPPVSDEPDEDDWL